MGDLYQRELEAGGGNLIRQFQGVSWKKQRSTAIRDCREGLGLRDAAPGAAPGLQSLLGLGPGIGPHLPGDGNDLGAPSGTQGRVGTVVAATSLSSET